MNFGISAHDRKQLADLEHAVIKLKGGPVERGSLSAGSTHRPERQGDATMSSLDNFQAARDARKGLGTRRSTRRP